MSNHLRVNNDTSFLNAHAANNTRGLSVEDALEMIVLDFKEYLIPGTSLVDYGPDMDGFSPTYKHVRIIRCLHCPLAVLGHHQAATDHSVHPGGCLLSHASNPLRTGSQQQCSMRWCLSAHHACGTLQLCGCCWLTLWCWMGVVG